MTLRIMVRGGGDLASGVVIRLHKADWQVLVVELPKPLAVRRYVSFAQAVYDGAIRIEDVAARRVETIEQAQKAFQENFVPVLVDPGMTMLGDFNPHVIVDGRMRKRPPETGKELAPLVVGLGPAFTAGVDCHAVIETNRGPYLGRVFWNGQAQADTGIPERVGEFREERVLRSPAKGILEPFVDIGTLVKRGEEIAQVSGQAILAPFDGVLRGLIMGGLEVSAGEKIGDIDPRGDARLCWLVSEKALAIGGGVLEAILTWQPIRREICA